MGTRDRLARLLGDTGMTSVALRVRKRARVPYLTVLTYHHVAEPARDYPFDPDVADATPAQFARQLDLIARHFNVIRIEQLCDGLDGAPLPPNPALITFDDGYRSCHDVALPLLAARGLSAVFFIPSHFVEERRLFWWERIAWIVHHARKGGVARLELEAPVRVSVDVGARDAVSTLTNLVKNTRGLELEPFLDGLARAGKVAWSEALERAKVDELLMTWTQIRALADAGMDIESHSRTHRVLQTLDASALDAELAGSRADLERAVGRPVRTIAYPVGRSIVNDPTIRDAVARAGYRAGFNNMGGVNLLGPLVPGLGRLGAAMPGARRVDPFDLARVPLDREISDRMFLGQLAFPPLAFKARVRAV